MLFKKNDKIVFFGDSITDCERTRPQGEGAAVGNHLGRGYVNVLFGHLAVKHPQLALKIVNKGIGGNRSADLLDRIEEDVINLKPNWVVLMIGINDVWRLFDAPNIDRFQLTKNDYRRNIQAIVDKCNFANIKVIICSPYFMETNKKEAMRQTMDEFRYECKAVAAANNLLYIDIQKSFDKLLKKLSVHQIARDKIHPNITGHTLIALEIYKAITKN